MKQVRRVPLAVAFLLVMITAGPLAAAAEEPVRAPSTHESLMSCLPAGDAVAGAPFAPIAASTCPYGRCQVNSDCFAYCCNTYGACSGDSICRRQSGSTCGLCLC